MITLKQIEYRRKMDENKNKPEEIKKLTSGNLKGCPFGATCPYCKKPALDPIQISKALAKASA